MSEESRPLSDEERAELEELRAEKRRREQEERDRRDREELERLRAERDGALGIICAPIVAHTVEKITSIQVYPVFPLDSVMKILEHIKDRY